LAASGKINEVTIYITTVPKYWEMSLPQMTDPITGLNQLTCDFGDAGNFLKFDALKNIIYCENIQKGGSSHIRSGNFLINLLFGEELNPIKLPIMVKVFEPPAIVDVNVNLANTTAS
jgi:hypothetical protein